jgi:hypothetical protein
MTQSSQYVLWSIIWILVLTAAGGVIGAAIARRGRR